MRLFLSALAPGPAGPSKRWPSAGPATPSRISCYLRSLALGAVLACWFLSAGLTYAQEAPFRFQEGAAGAGLTFAHVSGGAEKKYILESMSGGVALFDYDGDGWVDIYLVNGGRWDDVLQQRRSVRNALFRNRGDGTFEDVTEKAGVPGSLWDMGAVAADIDNDGDPDLYVTSFGPNKLYRNRGDGTFEDISKSSGTDEQRWSSAAAFGDYDGDGRLDLAVVNYVEFDPSNPPERTPLCRYRGIDVQCGPRGLPGHGDVLYRNLGDGRFQDVTESAGLALETRYYGLAASWTDYDNDADLDLLVANDSCPNYLFRNDGQGRFSEVAMQSGVALNEDGNEQAGMGLALGDPDGDGWIDFLQTNFSDDKNTLYANQKGFFLDASYRWNVAEVAWQYLSWGTFFFDADLDGYPDLFVANGHVYPEVEEYQIGTSYKQRDFLFHNLDGKRFEEVGQASGISAVENSRGAAVGDLDNDGRPDIVVNRLDAAPALYWNRSSLEGRNWIGLRLQGTASNRDAVGARLRLYAGGRVQTREVSAGGSYLSSHDPRLIFGLGSAGKIEKLEIRWPSGQSQTLSSLNVNTYQTLTEPTP
ncbi:MAG TPA: CRTAC1 family protein [Acidobacteriota bacterium]|nr:CRTAC1 family protein [Acidobacteriota bacterium]